MRHQHTLGLLLLLPALLAAQALPPQSSSELQQVLERLKRLEDENARLSTEVRTLRNALDAAHITTAATADTPGAQAPPATTVPIEERIAVQDTRVNELSNTSVQASQRLPVSLSGMILFNAYLNGAANGGSQAPLIASQTKASSNGASLRQSILGFRYQGPTILRGGKVSAALDLDLWGGSASSLNHLVRMRTASLQIDWANRSLMVGQDKPLVAQRDPTSLAQVALSPLTDAGNLWLWQPQVRVEQRIRLGNASGIRAQGSVYQTSEPNTGTVFEEYGSAASSRPALEGRFELWNNPSEHSRIELAPGFHVSRSRVGSILIPSHLFTVDWFLQPRPDWQLTGAYFKGQNAAGLGGLRQGFTYLGNGQFAPVHTGGGWAQLAWLPTSRFTLNVYTGQESNRSADLVSSQILRNFSYAGNLIYRLGSNVRIGAEASQIRTKYKTDGSRLVNHYDLALAYLF